MGSITVTINRLQKFAFFKQKRLMRNAISKCNSGVEKNLPFCNIIQKTISRYFYVSKLSKKMYYTQKFCCCFAVTSSPTVFTCVFSFSYLLRTEHCFSIDDTCCEISAQITKSLGRKRSLLSPIYVCAAPSVILLEKKE